MSKVLLFLPPFPGRSLGPPASLLCLAAPLLQSGYEVEIIDAGLVPGYLEAIESKLKDALCFGVTLLTGPMIEGAVKAARLVKSANPRVPVVFGGWHPSLMAEQTLHERFVDVVVRNQGEITFLELVQRIESGRGFDGIAGCSFKTGTTILHNSDRAVASLSTLPTPAYDLVDFDAYEKVTGERKLPYASSVGCPYACTYCTDTVFYNRRFNAHAAQRVVDEVTYLATRHRLNQVALLDSNFLVDKRRAVQIARGFLDAGAGFRWTFQTSTDLLCRLSDEEVLLLGESGVEHIGFGVESGSNRVLSDMNKRHQCVEDVFEAARKCRQAGIRATFNVILGFPGETALDRQQTFKIMGEVASRYDNVTFSANIFTPYPGIPIWPKLREMGLKEPCNLEDWTAFALGANLLPWLKGAVNRRIAQGIALFNLSNEVRKSMWSSSLSPRAGMMLRGLERSLHFRMKHDLMHWPLEQWLLKTQVSGSGHALYRAQAPARRFGAGS